MNLDRSDWLARVAGASLVIWKPPYMGHEFAGYVKEKIHFLEHHLGLTVVPGFETVWHFESKAAQSYLLARAGVPTPRTFVSFDYDEAVLQAGLEEFPVVLKGSAGAGSVNVRAVRGRSELLGLVRRAFSLTLWDRTAAPGARQALQAGFRDRQGLVRRFPPQAEEGRAALRHGLLAGVHPG